MLLLRFLSLYAFGEGLVVPWQWLAVVGEIPALLMLLLLCFMPDSPRYLIICGKQKQAHEALEFLRGPDSDFMTEFNRIELSISSQVHRQYFGLTASKDLL